MKPVTPDPPAAAAPVQPLAGARLATTAVVALLAAATSVPAHAEEGGSGHYLPGSIASFVDAVPASKAFIVRFNYADYRGEFERGKPLPIAGITALGVEAKAQAYGLTLAWRPDIDLGPKWSYAVSFTIPVVRSEVSADVATTLPGGPGAAPVTVRRTDVETFLGDAVLLPLMLNYQLSADLGIGFRVGAYAPTGSFTVGQLANTGKNFWTIEPTLGLLYFGQKNGREAAVNFGADFNEKNDDTGYKSGTQLHVDATFAQHLPLAGGLAGIGLNAYWYEQVEGDSGSGARFGDFEARTAGAGPVLSYVRKVGGGTEDFIAELKWLHEFETKNRLEGDLVWLKLILKR
jgi:hypothetical protein